MSPLINDDELFVLFKLSLEKDPVPTTLIHSAVSIDSLINKGYVKLIIGDNKSIGIVITVDGRWKYSTMVGNGTQVPRKITQIMKQKGLQ